MLDEEIGRADVDGDQGVEILDRGVLDRRGLGDAGVRDEDVEAAADDAANLLGEGVGAVGGGEVGRDRVGVAAGVPDLGDDGFGLRGAAAVVNEDLGAAASEGECAGAADAP